MEPAVSLSERVARTADELRSYGPALRRHALPILGAVAVVAVLYWSTLRWLWNAWMSNDYYTHGLLVPPVALWFLWRARHRLAGAGAARWQDLWLVAGALGLYALAVRNHDPFLFSLSLIALLGGLALYLLGPARAKHTALPIAFLVLAVPPPFLLHIGYELQRVAATGTTLFMSAFGVPVVQDNFLLTAGGLQFEVVPLCSGLSSSISILTLTTVVAAISPLRTWGRATLLLLAIPIALAANVLRIAITIAIGMRWGPEASQGFLHGASSLVLFLLALSGVLALSWLLALVDRKVRRHG